MKTAGQAAAVFTDWARDEAITNRGREVDKGEVALPWLDERRVVMGFAARSQPLPDAQPALAEQTQGGDAYLHQSQHDAPGQHPQLDAHDASPDGDVAAW